MAKAAKTNKKAGAKKATTMRVAAKKSAMGKSVRPTKVVQTASTKTQATNKPKNAFEQRFGEGTAFDLDYGKLLIIALCIYIAIQVS